MFALEPTLLERLRGHTLRALMSNAAPLPQHTKEIIVDYFGDGLLYELYGSTEAGIVCSLRPRDQLRKQQCVGHPFTMNQVKLLDDEGNPTDVGEVGELFSNSPCLFLGYWNNRQATEAAMRNGWFSAGDLAWQDEDGCYYIVDRKKDMYITGGVNVYPREIEELLFRLPGVREAAVIGAPDDYWGEAGTAFLVLEPGASLSPDEVIAACKQSLAGYKVPRHVVLIDKLPRNAAGKVHEDGAAAAAMNDAAPRTILAGRRTIGYRRFGEGPPVVLLHASPRSSATLLPLGLRLAKRFTVFAFNSPGFGWSDPLPVDRPDARGLCGRADRSVRRVGLRRVHATARTPARPSPLPQEWHTPTAFPAWRWMATPVVHRKSRRSSWRTT